jgi:hypothetical protein
MVLNTLKTKIIVITNAQSDISSLRQYEKKELEIPILERLDAAKLLMLAGKDAKHLKFKNEYDLAKH